MIAWLRARLHFAWGVREWELQAKTEAGYLHWSGPPFLTKREAREALSTWKRFDFFFDVVAVNVRTGWRIT